MIDKVCLKKCINYLALTNIHDFVLKYIPKINIILINVNFSVVKLCDLNSFFKIIIVC